MRVRVDGYYEDGAVWCAAMISCPGMMEQVGLFVICMHHRACRCYLNGASLKAVPLEVSHGDFLAIYKSDGRRVASSGLLTQTVASRRRTEHTSSTSSLCSSRQSAVPDGDASLPPSSSARCIEPNAWLRLVFDSFQLFALACRRCVAWLNRGVASRLPIDLAAT